MDKRFECTKQISVHKQYPVEFPRGKSFNFLIDYGEICGQGVIGIFRGTFPKEFISLSQIFCVPVNCLMNRLADALDTICLFAGAL